ncbi:uncharacterized protein FIBRA_00476 [Fibroporia radiculosa]|uniref:ubiquitinyl hydrolase 1 n=1 Tax=Fibroporia radiculosa TaxID=599839 RepID=J4G0A4_9APHY|nr:uncharacterized protein FIBRA_00476 [Fibroporia radiculosa]CCL98478.1 predicted protein [Fibroporia radiculosa]
MLDEKEFHHLVGGPFTVLESDPGVFTTLIRKLGIRGLEVTEIYDIEPWAVDHLSPHGLIFCYLCTDEKNGTKRYDNIDDPDAERVWFANQLSNDACATQAILNVLLNCPGIELGDELQDFRVETEHMSSVMKGLAISGSHFIRKAHNSLARPADIRGSIQSIAAATLESNKTKNAPPAKKQRTATSSATHKKKAAESTENQQDMYHFIGYVPAHNKVWELDGLRRSALEVGELAPPDDASDGRAGWIDVVRPALRMRMQRSLEEDGNSAGHIQFNLLAIVNDRYQVVSDELEMLKRERNALERRLAEVYEEGWTEKVDQTLLASASETFVTSVRPSPEGKIFGQDFGSRKMEKEISILDMPARKLPEAWEACIRAALSAKLAVEEEIAKSANAHTEEIKRTFDYEPFIVQFITCLHNEGLLDSALHKATTAEEMNEKPTMRAKSKAKGRGRA